MGLVERKHRHVIETGLALLAHASVPHLYWHEAFRTAVYLINRLPSPVLHSQSPRSCLFHKSPDYKFLRVFGSACWPNLHPFNQHKMDYRFTLCVFIGYNPDHKGYLCLQKPTGRLYVSRDVRFDEQHFPFATPIPTPVPTNPSPSSLQFSIIIPTSVQLVSPEPTRPSIPPPRPEPTSPMPTSPVASTPLSPLSGVSQSPPPPPPRHTMVTRSQTNSMHPGLFRDGTIHWPPP